MPEEFYMGTMKGLMDTSAPSRSLIRAVLIFMLCMIFDCFSPQPTLAYDKILTYRIGSVDKRFGLSPREISEAVGCAASLWEKAIGHDLFHVSPLGEIEINLVYDERQATSEKLKKISGGMDSTRVSYNELKARHDYLKAEIAKRKAAYVSDYDAYITQLNAYNAQLGAYPDGSVPYDVYRRLQSEKKSLDVRLARLQMRQEQLKGSVETLNGLVEAINDITSNLIQEVENYNESSRMLGGKFDQGRYKKTDYGKTITIYHFNDRDMLIRVLAHELGHALGLKHINNPRAIMYHLNQSKTVELTPEDIAALKERCK
jgi:hypothetical protein